MANATKEEEEEERMKKIKCRSFDCEFIGSKTVTRAAVEAYHKTSIYSIKCLARCVAFGFLLQRCQNFQSVLLPWESFLKGKIPKPEERQ